MSEWISWKGGECPVAPDMLVEIILNDGWVSKQSAGSFFWDFEKTDPAAICKYRVIEEPKKTAIPDEVNSEQEKRGWEKFIGDSKLDREELRIRAALAALQGLVSAPTDSAFGAPLSHFSGDPTSMAAKMSLEIADAFIEELERRRA